jgi:hypothetical protein
VPNTRYVRHVTLCLCPADSFVLGLELGEFIFSMIFNNVALNRRSFRTSLRPSLYEYMRIGRVDLARVPRTEDTEGQFNQEVPLRVD